MPGSCCCLLALLNNLQTGVSQHHQLAWKAESTAAACVAILYEHSSWLQQCSLQPLHMLSHQQSVMRNAQRCFCQSGKIWICQSHTICVVHASSAAIFLGHLGLSAWIGPVVIAASHVCMHA
jgi:hypothetical protein